MDLTLYGWCVLGIVTSVVLPPLWVVVRNSAPFRKAGPANAGKFLPGLWKTVKPYLLLGIASALTALILVFLLGDQISSPKAALLAGYAWDSTLQKLGRA